MAVGAGLQRVLLGRSVLDLAAMTESTCEVIKSPNLPGQVLLRVKEFGVTIVSLVFDLDRWEKLDREMRDAIKGKE